ncbi:MAG TPA: hypothetical protein VJR89_24820 [Polyangiales bacterium]|nr:hypothetical protein [Polyangiales bacterium]
MAKPKLLWLLVAACILLTPRSSRAGGEIIAIIANKDVALKTVTREELRPIFQTKKNTWPDGKTVVPFNLPPAHASRQGFDAAVLGLDPDRVAKYWIDRKIRGDEKPPQTAPSPAVMVKIVAKTAGAVGYVEASLADASVKVIGRISDGQVVKP